MDEVLATVELTTAARRRVGGYSLGMRQRLGIAAALLRDPQLLILDEPANGLDPEGVHWLRTFVRDLGAAGKTVLVSSHLLAEVAQTVDRVVIIDKGRLVTIGTLDELTARMTLGVRVRAPGIRLLLQALEARGFDVTVLDGDELLCPRCVHRPDRRARIKGGDRAARARAGIVLARAGLPRADLRRRFVIAQLRSELRKMATTRTNFGLLLGLIALVLFGVIAGAFNSEADLSALENQRELIGNGAFGAVFAALIGLMAMTGEFRHGTIRATFVFTPERVRVVAAKVVASIIVGIGFGALASGLGLGTGAAMIHARGYGVLIDSGDVGRLLLGTVVMSALWAALGVGLGALVRNQVAAIVGLFAWVFVVEILVFQYLPGVGRYAPGAAGTAMTGDTVGNSSVHLLSGTGWRRRALRLRGRFRSGGGIGDQSTGRHLGRAGHGTQQRTRTRCEDPGPGQISCGTDRPGGWSQCRRDVFCPACRVWVNRAARCGSPCCSPRSGAATS